MSNWCLCSYRMPSTVLDSGKNPCTIYGGTCAKPVGHKCSFKPICSAEGGTNNKKSEGEKE